MKRLLVLSGLAWCASLGAAPSVTVDSLTQDAATRTVSVAYTLTGEPGIVTLSLETNGVAVSEADLSTAYGDVNRVTQPGSRTIRWKPTFKLDDATALSTKAVLKAWATNAPPDYLVVDLTMWTDNNQSGHACTRFYTSTNALPFGGLANDMYRTTKLVMRRIPAANVKWRMGSPSGETGRKTNETTHYVTLSEDYYLGIYPVTVRQMYLITGWTDGDFRNRPEGAMQPYEKVSYQGLRGDVGHANWPDGADPYAVEEWKGIWGWRAHTGVMFDLPTEAQWEYACRAGESAPLYNGASVTVENAEDPELSKLCRYRFNGGIPADPNGGTCPVGRFQPNAWGLYDMLGNVAQLCLDRVCDPVREISGEQRDPKGESATDAPYNHAARGGGYNGWPYHLRSAYRGSFYYKSAENYLGFRLWCPVTVFK